MPCPRRPGLSNPSFHLKALNPQGRGVSRQISSVFVWIPAFAGMTGTTPGFAKSPVVETRNPVRTCHSCAGRNPEVQERPRHAVSQALGARPFRTARLWRCTAIRPIRHSGGSRNPGACVASPRYGMFGKGYLPGMGSYRGIYWRRRADSNR